MKNTLLILPLLLPAATAILLLFLRRRIIAQRTIHVVSSALMLAASGALVTTVSNGGIAAVDMGGWSAPFGITIVADLFAALMVAVGALIAFAAALSSLGAIDAERERRGYYVLLNTLMMGVNGAFLTGDVFNLYVWFEVLLISSFALAALGTSRAQLEGALKYVALNILASAFFLVAVGLLYGAAGTLNMADLSLKLEGMKTGGIVTAISMLFFVSFGIKAALFPLYFWLPASYHTLPVPVSALFAGLLTKVGIYALARFFTLLFTGEAAFTHTVILGTALITMVVGVLGAAAQYELRRLLSFHIISQIGYLAAGIGVFTTFAIAATIFYTIHHIIVKSNLFLISGLLRTLQGTFDIRKMGGLYTSHPGVAILFLIPAFSLAGFPPLSGFWAKFSLIKSAVDVGGYWTGAVMALVGALTIFSMTKVWTESFWKKNPEATEDEHPRRSSKPGTAVYLPIILLALFTVAIGLYAQPLFEISMRAAEQMMNRTEYIHAVLGGGQ